MNPKEAEHRQQEAESLVEAARKREEAARDRGVCWRCDGEGKVLCCDYGAATDCGVCLGTGVQP